MGTCKSGSKKQQTAMPSQTPLIRMDTEGAIERAHIKQVEFRENVRASFTQGQRKLCVINVVSILSGCL